MKQFLRIDPPIDGLITEDCATLLDLITNLGEFNTIYEVAKPGYNPFAV